MATVVLLMSSGAAFAQGDETPPAGASQPAAVEVSGGESASGSSDGEGPIEAPDAEAPASESPQADTETPDPAPAGNRPSAVDSNPAEGDNESLPRGTNHVAPLAPPRNGAGNGGGALGFSIRGFAHGEYAWLHLDDGNERSGFRPRELELDLEADFLGRGGVRIDLNVRIPDVEADFLSLGFERLLSDHIVEQAYVAWRPLFFWVPPDFEVRLGKMNAPAGLEALEPTERVMLTRSVLSERGSPSSVTGLWAGASLADPVDLYLVWFNGWNETFSGNGARSLMLGAPHRLLSRGDGSFWYSGHARIWIGGEDPDQLSDVRWGLAYTATVQALDWLFLETEWIYGQEEHKGLDRDTGLSNRDLPGRYFGGQFLIRASLLDMPLDGALRIDFLHDPDLLIGLPRDGGIPNNTTTQLGLGGAVRWRLFEQLTFAAEYTASFQRGDVAGVGLRRNFPLYELHRWFNTHRLSFAAIGTF